MPLTVEFDILVSAEGESATIVKNVEIGRKVLKGGQAIGITANFVNEGWKIFSRVCHSFTKKIFVFLSCDLTSVQKKKIK